MGTVITPAAGEGGTHSASDTPRRMSGLWSQCPWGSPALRWEGALQPTAPFIKSAAGERALHEAPLRRNGQSDKNTVGADDPAARLSGAESIEGHRWLRTVTVIAYHSPAICAVRSRVRRAEVVAPYELLCPGAIQPDAVDVGDGMGRTESSAPTEGWEPYATYDAFHQIRRRTSGRFMKRPYEETDRAAKTP